MTAQDIRNLRKVTYQLVEAEERSTHIRNLISHSVGLREEEEFRRKEERKLKGGKGFDRKKETIKLAMKEKQRDNFKLLGKLRLRNRVIRTIEDKFGRNSQGMRRVIDEVKRGAKVTRNRAKVKFRNKEKFLVKKYGGDKNTEN